jgi:hypothetical protein
MEPDCCFCGYCQEKNKNSNGLDAEDGQWLEEMENMIAAAMEGMRKVQSSSTGCYGRLVTA